MNIEELALQCWEARSYGPSWFDYRKFAKLIVKEQDTHSLSEKVLELESDLRVVTSLYADAVKRNVVLTERLENRAINLTNEQRDILTRMLINTINTY